MKYRRIKFITSATLSAVLSMAAIPVFFTPVFAEGTLTCEVKVHESGDTYTECTGDGELTNEQIQQTIKATQQAWEQETGYTYGVNIYEIPNTPTEEPISETPAPVHICQDDGYPEGYYWSENAQACVTDYVEPTTEPTPVTTPEPTPVSTPAATPEPTLEPIPDPVGGEYHSYVETRYWDDGTPYYCTVSYRDSGTIYQRIPWNNAKGYIIMGEVVKYPAITTCSPWNTSIPTSRPIPLRTAYPEWTPTPNPTANSTPKPTATPVATLKPTSTPSTTPTTSSWNYNKVSTSFLTLINNQRVADGVKPLSVVETAVTDAAQRAMESMEFAKETTAYGTTTDGHVGFDTEIGDTEVNSYVTHLKGTETEEEVANIIFTSITTGLGKALAPFSETYKTVGIGFTDSHFTSRLGRDLGYNVWFNLQLNK